MVVCKKCKAQVDDRYCSKCGTDTVKKPGMSGLVKFLLIMLPLLVITGGLLYANVIAKGSSSGKTISIPDRFLERSGGTPTPSGAPTQSSDSEAPTPMTVEPPVVQTPLPEYAPPPVVNEEETWISNESCGLGEHFFFIVRSDKKVTFGRISPEGYVLGSPLAYAWRMDGETRVIYNPYNDQVKWTYLESGDNWCLLVSFQKAKYRFHKAEPGQFRG